MSTGRVVGGILALVAGAWVLIGTLWVVAVYSPVFTDIFILYNIVIAALMIVGGILGLAKLKTVGGILALCASAMSIMGGLLAYIGHFWDLVPIGLLFVLFPSDFTYFFALETIIAIVGGIILLVSSSKE
jgi:hypothetical protein